MGGTMTIEELLKAGESQIRRVLIGTKDELTPIAHLVRADGRNVIAATPWRNATEKDMTLRMLHSVMQDDQIARYMLIHEAWMRVAEPGEFTAEQLAAIQTGDAMPAVGRIEEHPNRIEVVMALAVEKEGKTVRCWEIKRDVHGVCVELVEVNDTGDWKGPGRDLMN